MKQIIDYPDYNVSENGDIFSNKFNKTKKLKPQIDKDGYYLVHLWNNGSKLTKKIHHLVAQAYLPNPENKLEINHKNGIKTDNEIKNLEWITHQENMKHAYNNDYIVKFKLTWNQVEEIRKNHKSKGITKRKPWNKYGICLKQYYNVLNKEQWKGV